MADIKTGAPNMILDAHHLMLKCCVNVSCQLVHCVHQCGGKLQKQASLRAVPLYP
jgi:hypothetical protein